ncbi:2-phospho-L-lactate guanylyltransferase [Cohaesibacter haloalkalitolerans]|uniref:2-phospho-L-lactate guanylyltransferase n=1 Tax=Cohaesibacter haloalkalitolerans TaxID=1162980 RepID=UPI000E65A9BE|nr:2-phospho-L-lactate guanylyltransferase [Cohaesibacter haloalkalitolerans]
MTEKLLILIPMKDPSRAKSRLASGLSEGERSTLSLMLFKAVVERIKTALASADHLKAQIDVIDIAVVSSSEVIRQVAEELDILFLPEAGDTGLNDALQAASECALKQGYGRLCILPGDLADPTAQDIVSLLSYPVDVRTIIVCPSEDLGTNALVVPLPSPMPFSFGPDSFSRHFSQAADLGLMPVILPLKSLRRDIDTMADLSYLDAAQTAVIANGGEGA